MNLGSVSLGLTSLLKKEGFPSSYFSFKKLAALAVNISGKDVRCIYRYLAPMFIVLGMTEMTEEAVVSEYMAR